MCGAGVSGLITTPTTMQALPTAAIENAIFGQYSIALDCTDAHLYVLADIS